MAAELVYRVAILVAVRRFHGMSEADFRSLRSNGFDYMQYFVRRSNHYVPFRRFGWICGDNSCNVILLLMVLWVLIRAMLCKRAVLGRWHACMLLGPRHVGFFPLSSFLLGGLHFFFFSDMLLSLSQYSNRSDFNIILSIDYVRTDFNIHDDAVCSSGVQAGCITLVVIS
jgi:hypothetical protein